MEAAAAYRACARITRGRAGNFYYGIRLLPPPKRRALCAVYAFARRVDDVGDGVLPNQEKLRRLGMVRQAIDHIDPASGDPVLAALGHSMARFELPVEALGELIDGVEMDVLGATYETFEDLAVYCRRVAGTIGRLSVAIFGSSDGVSASARADDLGLAMQLTNILRDLREDLALGRCYLPRADADRFGVTMPRYAPLVEADGPLARLIEFEADRAGSWFQRGLGLVPMLDPRSASCVSAMTGIYRRILARIRREPGLAARGGARLPAWEKAWVAGRSLLGGRSASVLLDPGEGVGEVTG